MPSSDRPVLFLSNYFPPETNALANRTWEHARVWAEAGGEIEVVAGPPHFPEGVVYDGYANVLSRERVEGVDVLRVPIFVARNRGFVRRALSFVSYLATTTWYADRVIRRPGVVVASSPQFFAGIAGRFVSARLRAPFVLEVRDLWPESIVDVGAMQPGLVIRALERVESWLYRTADHVVVVSPAFQAHIACRGVPESRISVLPNGVDLGGFAADVPAGEIAALRAELGLTGRFVASYIGTVGMAHGVDVLVEAAAACPDPEVAFVVVGAGAQWDELRARAADQRLENLLVLEKQPRERIRTFYAMADLSLVLLKDRPAFRKVIPSKMFESMGMRIPIVLGVLGQAAEILRDSGAGLVVTPEDPDALLAAVLELKSDPERRRRMGQAGAEHVRNAYDRREIARRYWDLLQSVAASP